MARTEYTIRDMSNSDLEDVVKIHIKAFPGFFLTLLGRNFLFCLYKGFIRDDLSICMVAEKNTIIKGFVVGNLEPNNLFKKMLLKKGHLFLLHSVKALIRNPKAVSRKLLYAIRYRGERPEGFKNGALLSSIGIDPDEVLKGIGSHLVREFCQEAFKRGSDSVYLTTDKFGNDRVNAFYIKNGFHLESVIEKTGDRKMNRYVKLRD